MHQNDVVDHDAVVALLDAHWSRHVNELLMMIVMMVMMIVVKIIVMMKIIFNGNLGQKSSSSSLRPKD